MGRDTTDSRKTLLVWGALAIVYVVWGSTYLAIKIVVETLPPLLGGAMRFVTASLILGAVVFLFRGRQAFRMNRRELGGAALVGLLLLTGGNGMVAVAEQHISSGLAALLVASRAALAGDLQGRHQGPAPDDDPGRACSSGSAGWRCCR